MSILQDETKILEEINRSTDLKNLDDLRVALIGKKGTITTAMKALGQATPEDRKTHGHALNQLKNLVTKSLNDKKEIIEDQILSENLKDDFIDISLEADPQKTGYLHPITQTIEEIIAIFGSMGFEVKEGTHIEEDFYNFDALNIPSTHPARQDHDTFYVPDYDGKKRVLRTHTSPVQIRSMLENGAPLQIIAPGRTYRADHDQTHTPMFHQVEGLMIGKDITMGHLKGCLTEFLRRFFEQEDLPIRLRPSYFPFTEPSAEIDIGCRRTKDSLDIGHGEDWLEILGCGMVHPNVLHHGQIDPNHYQGFAFGMGIERIAMLKYGIPDLRTFFENDRRWVQHYGFLPKIGI